jgi:DNA end-binding protein Ku
MGYFAANCPNTIEIPLTSVLQVKLGGFMATSVWRGQLTFGLVSFPVKLFSAARSETISFNLLHKKDHSRIKQVTYCQAEDKPVPRSELVKGYEYEKDQYAVVEDEEIKKVAPRTAKVMEILEFVQAAEVDPVFLESSYYMAADENGRKPYALLFRALKDTGYFGIAKVAMHNREHIVILRPNGKGIMLHTMYYMNEIRKVEEFHTDTSLVKDKELELAKMLVQSLEAKFEPEKYKDTYQENLKALIEAKLQGREVVEAPAPRVAPVIDIMEALKQSLAQRKPVKAETAAEIQQEEEAEQPARKKRQRRAG